MGTAGPPVWEQLDHQYGNSWLYHKYNASILQSTKRMYKLALSGMPECKIRNLKWSAVFQFFMNLIGHVYKVNAPC